MSKAPRQESLFEQPDSRDLIVTSMLSKAIPEEKQQATFQRLIKQIHEQRTEIEKWLTYRDRYNQRVTSEMMPLSAQVREKSIALVRLLDAHYDQRGSIRGKSQRRKLRSMILDWLQDLLLEAQDEELVALHDKHSDLSHAEQRDLDMALTQDLVENMFGVSLDDDGEEVANMEEMILKATQKLQQEAEQRAAKRSPRRKSAKAAAAEEKRAAVEKDVSQSVREIYRKLASALHPDRASADFTPEQKHSLMQRVNRAYDAGNLLELLNIQLEIEQIDADHLANLSAERVAHYNHVLREQLAELKSELEMLQTPYRMLVPYVRNFMPAHVDRAMDGEIVRLKNDLRKLENDLADLQDPKQLIAALRHYEADDGLDELAALGELIGSLPMPAVPRRKR